MASHHVRRRDTIKGPPLRVLSLDGGGVRGYSMLIILQELMYKAYNETEGRPPRHDQIPKPCDYFDLIAGTGTGGLIAIMLGRLRLDIETCKDVYVRMTRKVFETDKTFAGIPFRSTLFKASKLEEAIRECVHEHTIFEDEGNDGSDPSVSSIPLSPTGSTLSSRHNPRQSISSSSRTSYMATSPRSANGSRAWGNSNALLYDEREDRTKTAVTAVLKGTPLKGGEPLLLRSYNSRKESPPEVDCTIWQAGRATAATQLAFKPIQIGQSQFIDEGAGKYNPAPQILDEAVINEWPGRELGVFVSIGTGKRPGGPMKTNGAEWWEGFMGGLGDFAEAKRRLISKIEGCEEIHQAMIHDILPKRGVNIQNYYRLNVEVGVGEFGMNEWQRLADISTSTRRYLARPEVRQMNEEAAAKLSRIETMKRQNGSMVSGSMPPGAIAPGIMAPGSTAPAEVAYEPYMVPAPLKVIHHAPPRENTAAVELPGDEGRQFQSVLAHGHNPHDATTRYSHLSSPTDKFSIVSSVDDQFRHDAGNPYADYHSAVSSIRNSHESQTRPDGSQVAPPPIPPKAPLRSSSFSSHGSGNSPQVVGPPPTSVPSLPPQQATIISPLAHQPPNTSQSYVQRHPAYKLPYPPDDGPPPIVNMAGKPEFRARNN